MRSRLTDAQLFEWGISLFALVLAYFIGQTAALHPNYFTSPGVVIAVLFGLPLAVLALKFDRTYLRWGGVVFLLTWTIATRSIHPTSWLTLYSVEVTIWALFGILVISSIALRTGLLQEAKNAVPFSLRLFLAVWILAIFWAASRNVPWTLIIKYTKQVFLLIPCLYVGKVFFHDKRNYRYFIWTLSIGALIIGILGILQYFGFIQRSLFGLPLTDPNYFVHFPRVSSIWGIPYVGEYLVLILPLFIYGSIYARKRNRAYYLIVTLITIVMIFLSGTRNAYLGMLVAIGVSVALSPTRFNIVLPIILMLVIYFLEASSFAARWDPFISGEAFQTDTSLQRRIESYQFGFSQIRSSPFIGAGVGASGWTLNSLLMIFQSTGITGGTLFLLGLFTILHTSYRNWRRSSGHDRGLQAALLAGFIGFLIPLNAGQPLFIEPQTVPFWFYCSAMLASKLPEKHAESQMETYV